MYMGESVYSIVIEPSLDGNWTSYLVMTPVLPSTGIPVQVTLIWDRDGTPSRPLTGPEGTTRESSQTSKTGWHVHCEQRFAINFTLRNHHGNLGTGEELRQTLYINGDGITPILIEGEWPLQLVGTQSHIVHDTINGVEHSIASDSTSCCRSTPRDSEGCGGQLGKSGVSGLTRNCVWGREG